MKAYYNEIDQYAAQWLRNLIAAGHIAPGDVDTRSIEDVRPDDVRGYTQCHFFAGIGVWSYALRRAGWADDRPVWTGSCPCQPFSVIGKQRGENDERHLWPEFRRLIAKCRPPTVIGEQVASKAGRLWLAGVRTDLEDLGFGVGAADLCAAGVGAPHIRQRLYWLADASGKGLEGYAGDGDNRDEPGRDDSDESGSTGPQGSAGLCEWGGLETVRCADGAELRLESGIEPLVTRPSARVGRLRAYGNAIVAPLAAEFIRSFTG